MRDQGPERGALGLPHQGRCVVAQIEVVHVALVHDGVQHRHRPAARIRRCDGGGGWQHLLCQSHPAAAGYNASRCPRPCLTSLGFRVTSSMYIEVKCCPLAGRGTPSVVISAHGMLLAVIAARSKAPDRLSSMKHASTGHTDIRRPHTRTYIPAGCEAPGNSGRLPWDNNACGITAEQNRLVFSRSCRCGAGLADL